MRYKDFKEGFVAYTVAHELPPDFSLDGWDDGYIAFSNKEFPVNNKIKGMPFKDIIKVRYNKGNLPPDALKDAEGYLMELDLWRHKDGVYEEISIEREDRGFLVQHWKLYADGKEGDGYEATGNKGKFNCYYYWRVAETKPRGNSIFKDLKSIEVVYPEHRLHFFLTVGGGNDDKRQD